MIRRPSRRAPVPAWFALGAALAVGASGVLGLAGCKENAAATARCTGLADGDACSACCKGNGANGHTWMNGSCSCKGGGASTLPSSAPTTAAPAAAAAGTWKVGDKVDVEWGGKWWQGQILEAKGELYKVHYTGWSAKWDETVTKARLRAPTATAARGTEAAN